MAANTFLYFGYASNMLKERLLLENPSAQFVTIAKLVNYRLCFRTRCDPSKSVMKGAMANIECSPGDEVWGVVWKLSQTDMDSLNRQEAAHKPISVSVLTEDGSTLTCHCFQMAQQDFMNNDQDWDQRPSPQYKDIIVRGAKQHGIHEEYVSFLQSFPVNDYKGKVQIYDTIMKELVNH